MKTSRGAVQIKSHYKITFIFSLLVALVLFGLYFYLDHSLRKYTTHRIEVSLSREITLAKTYLDKTYTPGITPDHVDEIADKIGADLGLRATIIAPDGVVLGDSFLSRSEIVKLENHLDRPEVKAALQSGQGMSRRFSVSLHEDMSYLAIPFGHPFRGILRLAVPLSEISEISRHLEKVLWVSIVFSLGLFVAVGFFASIKITQPIERISKVAQNIAAGDYSQKLTVSRQDEIGELARAVDFMSQQIKGRMDELTAAKSRLEAVFLSMIEGVMVVSKESEIVLMNQTLKNILHVDHDPTGRKPLEVIRNIEVQDIVDKVLKLNGGVLTREMTFLLPEEKIVRVHAAPVLRQGKADGAVLVFHDITDLRRLETIRKDFVANVSHELRTPVANIKGYAETLIEGALDDPEHAMEFLKIIYSESDRLAKLVDDLLDLARLESENPTLVFKACHIGNILEWVMAGLKIQAQDRGITIRSEVSTDLPLVRADESAIAQIFLNLIENAIKYNRPNGVVVICARPRSAMIEVEVKDTGIGIPQEDLPRIFERFYRVDKARSRELGGTGLGLSIVKHIVAAHGGHVSVESELGAGTTFRFTIPQA